MAVIIPPGYAQVIHELQLAGSTRPMIVTYGVSIESVGSLTMANNIQTAFASAWDDFMADDVTIGPTTLRVGQDGTDPISYESTVTPTVGGSASTFPPPNTAMLIKKQTLLGGRRNRGRMYLPFVIPEAGVDNTGLIDPTFLSSRQTAATSWLTALETVSGIGVMVILHSEGPSTPAPVAGLTVDPKVATQRKRLRR